MSYCHHCASLGSQLAERTRELEAERATSHGLRLLNGANDAVQVRLLKERDEARAESEYLKERLSITAHVLIAKIGASGPENADAVALRAADRIAKLEEALRFYANEGYWTTTFGPSTVAEVDAGDRARRALAKGPT